MCFTIAYRVYYARRKNNTTWDYRLDRSARTFFSFEKRDLLSGRRVYTIETQNRHALNHKFVIFGHRPPRPLEPVHLMSVCIYLRLFRYHDYDAPQNGYIV